MNPSCTRRRRVATTALTVALITAGCGSDGDTVADAESGGADEVSTTTTTTTETTTTSTVSDEAAPAEDATTTTASTDAAEPVLEETVVEFDDHTLVYADLQLTLEQVTASNAEPRSFGEPDPRLDDQQYLYAEFSVTSLMSRERSDSLSSSSWFLESPTGEPMGADGGGSTSLAALDTDSFLTRWVLPDDFDWQNATIVIIDGDALPARFALSGPEPLPVYPVTVELGITGAPDYRLPGGDLAEVTVHRADFDVNLGGQMSRDPRRPDTGFRFVRVEMTAVNNGDRYRLSTQTTDPRVFADGLPYAPVAFDEHEPLPAGSFAEVTWAFAIPIDTEELLLRTGDDAEMEVTIPVPELPLMPGEVVE